MGSVKRPSVFCEVFSSSGGNPLVLSRISTATTLSTGLPPGSFLFCFFFLSLWKIETLRNGNNADAARTVNISRVSDGAVRAPLSLSSEGTTPTECNGWGRIRSGDRISNHHHSKQHQGLMMAACLSISRLGMHEQRPAKARWCCLSPTILFGHQLWRGVLYLLLLRSRTTLLQ